MTVIAYRDGVIAADSLEVFNNKGVVWRSNSKKLYKLPSGAVHGWAGESSACEKMAALLREADKTDCKLPNVRLKNIEGIFVDGRMNAFFFDGSWWYPLKKKDYMAVGAGYVPAFAAMDNGADAVTAVKTAIKRNAFCGGRIQKLTVNG